MTVAHERYRCGKVRPIIRIAHLTRRGARYVIRRRIHFRNITSRPLALALQTADPSNDLPRTAPNAFSYWHVPKRNSVRLITCDTYLRADIRLSRTQVSVEMPCVWRSVLLLTAGIEENLMKCT